MICCMPINTEPKYRHAIIDPQTWSKFDGQLCARQANKDKNELIFYSRNEPFTITLPITKIRQMMKFHFASRICSPPKSQDWNFQIWSPRTLRSRPQIYCYGAMRSIRSWCLVSRCWKLCSNVKESTPERKRCLFTSCLLIHSWTIFSIWELQEARSMHLQSCCTYSQCWTLSKSLCVSLDSSLGPRSKLFLAMQVRV